MLNPILHQDTEMPNYPSHEFHSEDDLAAAQLAIGVTPTSRDNAIAAARDERVRNGLDPDTGKFPDAATFIAETAKKAIPGAVIEFHPRNDGPAPESLRCLQLQAEESHLTEHVAKSLSALLFNQPLTMLDPRQQVDLRYRAAGVVRGAQDTWQTAARLHAVESLEQTLEEDTLFASWPEYMRKAFAQRTATQAIAAYLGILEGTVGLLPGLYLRIVDGAQ
jgi:hypothetical protein